MMSWSRSIRPSPTSTQRSSRPVRVADDVVRVTYYLLDADDFEPCWPSLRAYFGEARPAATMLVVAGLADPKMRIEIEVTARKQS